MHPKISSLTPPMILQILKKRNICESPIHQEASNKISTKSDEKQRSYSIFSNGVKIAKFSEIFASKTPNFRFFRLFIVILKVHDERNRMAFVPSKPLHQLTYSREPTSNRVNQYHLVGNKKLVIKRASHGPIKI